MATTYSVEPAKSNRSTCKRCKTKIAKDALRVGTTVPGLGDYDMTSWRHLECQKKPEALGRVADLTGSAALSSSDTARLAEWWANPSAYAAKRRAEDLANAVADAELATASASPPPTPKKAKLATAAATTPDKQQQATVSPASASSASAPPPIASAACSGVMDEAARRDEHLATFNALQIPALKSCLRENGQILGGSKGELVERCVDRKLYGNLPRCTKCGIGRLKVAYMVPIGHGGQGVFSCPGGYDDDEYVRCAYRSTHETRPAWLVTEHEVPQKSARKSGGGKSAGGAPAATAS